MTPYKSLISLALGTFGLGITEFMMMGILPFVAKDFNVSIPTAGYLISAYALGVCVGAPIMAIIARKWPLKKILLLLVSFFAISTLGVAFCPANAFWLMMLFRFLQGLPHGSYFSVGCLVADKLAPENKSSFCIAIMCAGMPVANILGVPLGSFVAGLFSWRYVFLFTAIWGLITLLCLIKFIPYIAPLHYQGLKKQFDFLKHGAPWLIVGATLLGNGGMFCWYSYVSPMLTNITKVPLSTVPFLMILTGIGMLTGNLLGGKIADKLSPGRTGRIFQVLMLITLLGLFYFSQYILVTIPLIFLATLALFGVSSPQQLLLIRYAKGGELIGGALVQIAFNIGNALGAYAGGLPITLGYTYKYPALVGAGLVVFGIGFYSYFIHRYEKN